MAGVGGGQAGMGQQGQMQPGNACFFLLVDRQNCRLFQQRFASFQGWNLTIFASVVKGLTSSPLSSSPGSIGQGDLSQAPPPQLQQMGGVGVGVGDGSGGQVQMQLAQPQVGLQQQ